MKNLIEHFSRRHLLANVIFFGVILSAIVAWITIGKEELPEFASNWVRVSTYYPGASAEDVELSVTRPLEDELKGVIGIDELVTTSSLGVSSLRITLDDNYPLKDEVVREIKDAVYRVKLPVEVRTQPRIRQFKSSEKAILDIGIYHKNSKYLDADKRKELQKYVLGFESQLLALNEISSINRSHYRKPEIKILVSPEKKRLLQMSLSEIKDQIKNSHIRVPIGSLKDKGESRITVINELDDSKSLMSLILKGTYEKQGILLKDVASILNGYKDVTSIFKINGHEGIFLNVKKSVSTDILTAHSSIMKFIKKFNKANVNSPVQIVLMDDESYAVRNRISIITSNGLMGFVLIIIILLIFLDIKSGFWVAMGIPFSISFTLIIASMVGYTVNNMTLAGIIIVLGIVVDDAIIVAENISRHREEGMSLVDASVIGTSEVIKPIIASIITTCAAFLPLIFFNGFFGKLVAFIPLVVVLMLCGSLIESLLVLPSHLSSKTPFLDKFSKQKGEKSWYHKYEGMYERFLLRIFKKRVLILLGFTCMLILSAFLFKSNLKFVMFPREESQEVFIKVKVKKSATRQETALLIEPLEEIFVKDNVNVVGVRSTIALSRWGGEVKENEASILVELRPADERKVELNDLLKDWKKKSDSIDGLKSVKFIRGRWGRGSGSSIEIQIQENSNFNREQIAERLLKSLNSIGDLEDVELEKPLEKKEYIFKLKQDRLVKYDIDPSKVTSTLRTFVEGTILYSINKGDEEIDVRLTVADGQKTGLDELLNLRVENRRGQRAYLRKLVEIKEVTRPVNIKRTNFKRSSMVYANIKETSDVTPLQIAKLLEENIFVNIAKDFPTSILSFKGEIEDSRESQGDFRNSIIIVIGLIYLILILMFNSLIKPFLVLSVVPFGLCGVVFVLMAHGMSVYGFFAVIGALGMIGVVINDAIIMIDKIEKSIKSDDVQWETVARVASTRLRPVVVTTLTTVAGVLPTAYGLIGYDSMLSEMMLTMGWGLAFGTIITLILIPILYTFSIKKIQRAS